jgi:phage gp36-like protein
MAWITKAQLESRISARVVEQIYDDESTGYPEDNVISRLLEDATSYVAEAIEDVYKSSEEWPLTSPYPSNVVRLTLDAAEAYAAKRHPEYVKRDWEKCFKHLDLQLDRLREAKRSTGTSAIEAQPIVGYTDARRGWR